MFSIVSGNHQKEAELASDVTGQLGYWFLFWSLRNSNCLKCTKSMTREIKGQGFPRLSNLWVSESFKFSFSNPEKVEDG